MSRAGRYRGRKRLSRILGGLGLALLIVSLLAATSFLFLRDHITRTDDGLLLSFPFLERLTGRASPPPAEPSDLGGADLIVDPSPPAPEPTPTPEPDPVPVVNITISPAFLAQRDINSSARLDELAAMGDEIDTIIIEVKSTTGAIAAADTLAAAAERLGGRGQLVAYFSALEDNSITRQRELFGIKHTSGVNWLDANQSRWINPYVPETREWLAAQLSAIDPDVFAAVLIDKLWFPTEGRLEVTVLPDDPPRDEIIETLKNELIQSTVLPCWLVDLSTGGITYQGGTYAEFPQGAFDP